MKSDMMDIYLDSIFCNLLSHQRDSTPELFTARTSDIEEAESHGLEALE
jgi:hypothetical protein